MTSRSRMWCFTLNNYEDWEYARLASPCSDNVTWKVVGKEVGKNGTPHLQGCIRFKNPIRLSTLKKNFSNRAHWEIAKGTAEENLKYCSKDGDYMVDGELPTQGKRNDLEIVREWNKNLGQMPDIIDEGVGYQALRMAELMLKYRKPKARPELHVTWVWGPTGTGKTVWARQECPNAWINSGGLKWWFGYQGETEIILDDFRAEHVSFSQLLRILDVHPLYVEVKGGHVPANYTKVIITSDRHPEDCYDTEVGDLAQLTRRIHDIKMMGEGSRMPRCDMIWNV